MTSLEGNGPFWLGPRIPLQTFLDFSKGIRYQSIFTYIKFSNGDQKLARAYWGGTYGGVQGPDGTSISDILQDERDLTDGEVELHEWLHQIDWMFTAVHGYPQAASVNPDTGRRLGDEGGDPDYKRSPSEINWLGFNRHIMEDHITRRMWKEATMRDPKPTPWLKRRG